MESKYKLSNKKNIIKNRSLEKKFWDNTHLLHNSYELRNFCFYLKSVKNNVFKLISTRISPLPWNIYQLAQMHPNPKNIQIL